MDDATESEGFAPDAELDLGLPQKPAPKAARYRKRPIELEAREVTRATGPEVAAWCGGTWREGKPGTGQLHAITVPSLEGDHTGRVFDWVLKGTRGEFWVVEGSIFAEIYEPADTPDSQVPVPRADLEHLTLAAHGVADPAVLNRCLRLLGRVS